MSATEKTGFGGIWIHLRRGRMDLGDGVKRAARLTGNARIAARLRKKLLVRLEKVADAIPDGAVTEVKAPAQADGATTLFKLRDLTAAYRDLAGDMAGDGGGDTEDWSPLAHSLGPNDCAIIVSYSGTGPQREPVSFAPLFAQAGTPVIAITNSGDNWLREQCDCVLSFKPLERYYSKISGYYSEQSIYFLLDALYSAIFCDDYDRNEVRKLHTVIAFERQHHQNLVDELPY